MAPSRGQADTDTPSPGIEGGPGPEAAVEDEWEEVSLEGGEPINWDETPTIEGLFKGKRDVDHDGDTLLMLVFDDRDLGRCFTWAGPKLRESFEYVTPGSYVRCSFVGTKDVGRPSPMRLFKVQVRKSSVAPDMPPRGPGSHTLDDGSTF